MEDAAEALALARSFLLSRPVEHNLVLTILHERQAHPVPGRYWVVLDGGDVVGVALRTPLDFVATVTPMSRAAVASLVDAVIADAPDLHGINGEASTVATFAGCWAERTRLPVQPLEAHRLYHLARAPDPRPATGTLRPARAADAEVLVEWSRSFRAEIGLPHPGDTTEATGRRIQAGRLWVWEDEEPVSAAGASPALGGVVRVNFVYTPPARRRRGYAGGCVSALSAHLLATEAGTCVLYTQLANPTSNGLYHSIGYRPVSEILLYRFGTGGPPPGE